MANSFYTKVPSTVDKSCGLMKRTLLILFLLLFGFSPICFAKSEDQDSIETRRKLLQEARVKASQEAIRLTIRNVDISRYPDVKIIVEAYNIYGTPLDTLYAKDLTVLENNIEKDIVKIEKISVRERVPVDFVFCVDQTGTMQRYIDGIRLNLSSFMRNLVSRGIDYKLSLVLFSDWIEKVYQPTNDVNVFLEWIARVKAQGGGDVKENALEALRTAAEKINYRPAAERVIILVTDAPFHDARDGSIVTELTSPQVTDILVDAGIRVFCIVPQRMIDYREIASRTRGNFFDIDYPFSTVLDNFSAQFTNVYAITYTTLEPAIPDSINIAILDENQNKLVHKSIPIVELGRKLIIENLLYETNSFQLPEEVIELEVLTQFMHNKQNVVILVEGHTDDVGSHAINDRLSLLRAESVKNYLVRKGISPQRIKTTGYGKRRPIASNRTEWGKRLNRRTEIVIVAK